MKLLSNNKVLYYGLIITFSLLYVSTAFVSWFHAITFFNIANAVWLSVILSFVCEIGQASVLFEILSSKKQKFLSWAIMILLTTLQVIGNVVSSYKYIVESNSSEFLYFQKSILFWVQTTNPEMFKVIIAWIVGGILPIIALSMTALVADKLHLGKDNEEDNREVIEEHLNTRDKDPLIEKPEIDLEISEEEHIKKYKPDELYADDLEPEMPLSNNFEEYYRMNEEENKNLYDIQDDITKEQLFSKEIVDKIKQYAEENTKWDKATHLQNLRDTVVKNTFKEESLVEKNAIEDESNGFKVIEEPEVLDIPTELVGKLGSFQESLKRPITAKDIVDKLATNVKDTPTLKLGDKIEKIPINNQRGWHLKKEYVDDNGDIYHFGKFQEGLSSDSPKKA